MTAFRELRLHLNHAPHPQASTLASNLEGAYSDAKICPDGNRTSSTCMHMDPGVTKLMATSRNYVELTWAFTAWRDQSGKKMKSDFTEYVKYLNIAARKNGFADEGERWRSWYETETFQADMETLFVELKPLYEQLHGFTRYRLQNLYAKQGITFPSTGHIPSHIMG